MDLVVIIDTGFSGAEHEVDVHVDDAEWEAMSPEKREAYMQEEIQVAINDNISGEWKTAEEHYG
jgi:hypothetical protein